jgi:CRP/FNR family cyclic AMP-dependent transcriptional regulator
MGTAILDRVGALRRTALFRHLSESELAGFCHQASVRRLRRDEPLVFEGEEAAGLFVLAEGSVRVYREAADGREQVIRIEHAVTTLNEVHLFDGGPHPASISACDDALILWLQFSRCRQRLNDSPELALGALELMAERLRSAFDLVHSLSLLGVDQRLARFLLEEAHQRGMKCPDGVHVELNMSNQQIGAVIGAVREVVSRSMSKLQKRRLILFHNRTVVIPDEKLLTRFASSRHTVRDLTAVAG